MKRLWEISSRRVITSLVCWLVITNILILLTHTTDWWPFKVLLFVSLMFLPGAAILRSIRIVPNTMTLSALYCFGLSLFVLMISGLIANQLLHAFGVARPLELWGILSVWNIVTAALIVLSAYTNHQPLRMQPLHIKNFSGHAWVVAGLSTLLPFGAALGAFRLNNGGDALFAGLTLVCAAVLIAYVFLYRRHIPNGVLAWFIFIIGLTILLMTSLRGWDIVGHDIAREFRVYTLTSMHGHWNIALDRDPYNACLSITILPDMFATLLNVSGLFVFKVILQIIFAVCPVVIYVLLRQYVPTLGALAGSILFICYPTFVNDSAMLTRQGVAYLFFALAILVLANETQRRRCKLLFLVCATGAILSHYSTAYMFVALFAAALACKLLWHKHRPPASVHERRTALSPLFAGLLVLLTFVWYSQITGTSEGLTTTIQKTIVNIPQLFSDDNKSTDTSTVLLMATNRTQADLYDAYLTDSRPDDAVSAETANNYMPELANDDLPLTWLGHKARSIGIDPSIITTLRQNFAKLLQLLALAGVLYASYRLFKGRHDSLNSDFICLSVACIILLAFLVILPFLSVNYGILRAFQQSLIFLLLPITLLLVHIGQRIPARASIAAVTTGIVTLFLLFTGVFAQMLGGVSPTLSMNNYGLYFGLYYSPEADSQSFKWLKENIAKGNDVRAANFLKAHMHDPNYPFSKSGILPSQTTATSYTYLDNAQVKVQKFYTYYQSSPLITTFPLDYYQNEKNQIYSTTTTRVYR